MELMTDLAAMEPATEVVDREEQQREEWFRKRAGKFTCSQFGELAKSGRGKDDPWSQTAWNYLYQIAAERCGSFSRTFRSVPGWMPRPSHSGHQPSGLLNEKLWGVRCAKLRPQSLQARC